MSISDETIQLGRQLRRDLEQITDAQTRDLVAAWARAWDEVAGDLDAELQRLTAAAEGGRLTRTALLQSQRLRNALQVITDELTRLAEDAGVRIVGDLQAVVDLAGRGQHGLISSQLPAGEDGLALSWSHADPHAIAAVVDRSTRQITKLTRPLSAEATAVMKRELLRGVAVGANPRQTAARMLARTEGRFNGGLTRALVISRTETLDAYRAGARVAQHLNADVLAGWVWTAELDKRTCPACFAMHGTEHDLDESGPDGHQQCRCARTPLTKTWRELGFDIDEPPSAMQDAGEVFDGLDPAEQLAVLGRRRYDAYRAGDFPIQKWAVKQSNRGWRDSYVPATVPA